MNLTPRGDQFISINEMRPYGIVQARKLKKGQQMGFLAITF